MRIVDAWNIKDAESIRIVDQIKKAFDSLVDEHTSLPSKDFNDDNQYKKLTADAIDLKCLAIEKMETFLKFKHCNIDILNYIFDCELDRFTSPHVVHKALETSVFDFPWESVNQHVIQLDSWQPNEAHIDTIAEELKRNHNLQKIVIKGLELELISGWKTEKVVWRYEAGAIQPEAFALVVQLLLRNCSCMKFFKLDLG